MPSISFKIYSLGCKVNQYDGAVLRRKLEERGFKLAGDKVKPDIVVINTCTVTQKAIAKDRQLIAKLKRDFPQSLLVIMGCWPETDQKVARVFGADRVIIWGVGRLEKLLAKIMDFFSPVLALKKSKMPFFESGLVASSERSRYFIKVGDGCNQFCSYCLIPFARGRLSSRPSSELVKEICKASAKGYREIILSGIHLGRYGEDKKGKELGLVGLLKRIVKIKNLGRVRLSSIEITEVSPALIKLMKTETKICQHLHISLQSGSDKILKAMRRPYTIAYFQKQVAALRKVLPEIAISTDIIVGFPGESDDDFEATYNFATKIKFSKIHVFSFSAHEKTRAYQLPNKLGPAAIKERSRRLRQLSEKLEREYQNRILKLYSRGGLSLVKEKGGGKKERVKTEFGFDLLLSRKEIYKNTLV